MSHLQRPRLRATVTGQPDPQNPEVIWLYDSFRLTRAQLGMARHAVPLLQLFNGENELRDIQVALMRLTGGQLCPMEILEELTRKLDEAFLLDGPHVRQRVTEFLESPIRAGVCFDSQADNADDLRQFLHGQFQRDGAAGHPQDKPPDGRLRGALIPHIDYVRGGHVYTWGYKELVERSDATVFVIIGTSHYCGTRYILTRKDFKTPFGIAETDKAYVDRIAQVYGEHVFEDELAHLPEHSIELEVVFLQHCLAGKRPFKIVPLLVGPFQDCIEQDVLPHEMEDIYLMTQALRHAERECGEKVCYISSGDLAHIGPKFGDDDPVHAEQLAQSKSRDHALLTAMEGADRERFFRVLFDEQDARRICGFPPTYTLLSVLQPEAGRLLSYDQYVEPNGFESVSFASLAFYGGGVQ